MLGDYRIQGRRATDIAADVERAVSAGRLEPGQPLPPLRELAEELGVNPNTVAAAYRLLRDRGVIETAGRKGSRIRPRPVTSYRDQVRLDVPAGARNLAAGNPDPALLPPLGPALAVAAAAADRSPVLYGQPTAEPELAAFATAGFRADKVPEGAFAVTNGALDAIDRVLATQLRPGDAVAVEDPGWGSLLDLLPAHGLRTLPVALDDQGPRPAALAAALAAGARALIVTSRAQNPTGAAITAARAAELRAVLAGHPDVLLLEDDHGHGITELPFATLIAGPDGRPLVTRWVVVRSAAKAFGPDLRLAVLTGDRATVDRLRGRQRLDTGWVSHLLQRATAELWRTHGARPAGVAEAYRGRREALLAALAAHGIAGHGVSGVNVWIPVPEETGVVVGLLQRGWVVTPGAAFRVDSPSGIRVTIARLDPAEAPRFAADLAAVLGGSAAGARQI
ncbi:aminotransferase class I/II-fold pyridoxal phosphate-dependent enzyme [Kitasatospora sp. NBC_01287]|uniref:aminotransferase class I/II-fold pyridoxal phosphate-dependent enzyme n=1 Tax=Kitasatospora sp. NBC_01287 TaxID=2903573 RepID=UPI00224FA962|nr:aminotransferase class I/II-fold pyridoxal phosphate-dependent enzyme [Kitasatospora sp. NBC_01287]MCX4750803.1 aminotransferase class I/II-fold pyridoxal phosphate-dependent enzyme [Kitasatospora sp. NBC_01287]